MKTFERDLAARLHDAHFSILDQIRSTGCDWSGSRNPRGWAERTGAPAPVVNELPKEKFSRKTLKDFCADGDNSPEVCFAAVMAWGGMKYDHGRTIWRHRDSWRSIVTGLRAGELSRMDAYHAFKEFRANNSGCGMGPAYFTKLIYFCDPDHDGYIMDQWTSLSVNLLFSVGGEEPIVHMMTSGFGGLRWDVVSDKNTPETYEAFCKAIEFLADRLGGTEPEIVEERLFSKGGLRSCPWRSYVKKNLPPPRK